jgi:hypothetical protein
MVLGRKPWSKIENSPLLINCSLNILDIKETIWRKILVVYSTQII